MAVYNVSNLTSTNLYEAALTVNQIEPFFFNLIILSVGIIMFSALSVRYSTASSLLASTFTISLISVVLFPTGLITTQLLFGSIVTTAGIAAAIYLMR